MIAFGEPADKVVTARSKRKIKQNKRSFSQSQALNQHPSSNQPTKQTANYRTQPNQSINQSINQSAINQSINQQVIKEARNK